MCNTKIFLAMIFNEIKCCVNTSLGLVGGNASPASPPLCPRLVVTAWEYADTWHVKEVDFATACNFVFSLHRNELERIVEATPIAATVFAIHPLHTASQQANDRRKQFRLLLSAIYLYLLHHSRRHEPKLEGSTEEHDPQNHPTQMRPLSWQMTW